MRSREKVLDLLVKLKAMADESRSGSPEEAAVAAAQMQKLMFEHKIGMAEIEAEEGDGEEPIAMIDMIGSDRSVVSWKLDLAGGIAHSNFCRVVYQTATRKRRVRRWHKDGKQFEWYVIPAKKGQIELFGRQSDIDTVLYMHQYLCKEVDRLAKDSVEAGIAEALAGVTQEQEEIEEMYQYGDISDREYERRMRQVATPTRRKWMNAFRNGCVSTICIRLREQRAASEVKLQEERPQCTALVKKADAAVDAHVEQRYPKLGSGRSRSISDIAGFLAGKAAGQSISLGGGKGLRAPAPQLKGGK